MGGLVLPESWLESRILINMASNYMYTRIFLSPDSHVVWVGHVESSAQNVKKKYIKLNGAIKINIIGILQKIMF